MKKTIALIGSPNCGKTSLFNRLTGLNQKVGNFPGVTVDKKTGVWETEQGTYTVVDLPGTYSLHPKSPEEEVVINYLNADDKSLLPDVVLVVIDQTNLRRNLLLFTQVADLGLPVFAVLNMSDLAVKRGIEIDIEKFKELTSLEAISINAREGDNIDLLEQVINKSNPSKKLFCKNKTAFLEGLDTKQHQNVSPIQLKTEVLERYEFIDNILDKILVKAHKKRLVDSFDKVLLHPVWGYVIFFSILFFIFQLLFTVSSYPMDIIDGAFSSLQEWIKNTFGNGPLVSLLADGVIAGIGGVVIFIPQIAFLFLFLGLLEESGYMARVVFLLDKWMNKIGMSGRSVVPMISATACAIPAVMGARTIRSTKERLITIFVSPLISCSARLPVYAVFIALLVPENLSGGFIGLRGLLLMGLYSLGFLAAIVTSWLMHRFVKFELNKSMFVMEMPEYRVPKWSNIGITVYQKSMAFVLGAGKIILSISIILWVLASYGPSDNLAIAKQKATTIAQTQQLTEHEADELISQYQLEASYIGISGKFIEPVIRPLGYDWKIGIGLIASFAAREVFIGTLATIYSIGSEDEATIAERIRKEKFPSTGKPVYTVATSVSLLLFYVFAMQCMSTLAIVKKETNSWKWPTAQFIYMTTLAYFSAWLAYVTLS
jgi:ferrous iron transport protein B